MINTKEDFNNKIMQNIGLEIDDENCIIDEETGNRLQIKGKFIKMQVDEQDRNSVEFNPLENPTLMNRLFSYFLDKNERETGIGTKAFSHSVNGKRDKGYVVLIQQDETTYVSDRFYNDSLKYADIILKMNSPAFKEDLRSLDGINTRGGRNVSAKQGSRSSSK